jgi:hypothetical protein
MSTQHKTEKDVSIDVASTSDGIEANSSNQLIYIDPAKEKAAFKKFDRYTVPATFVFMLLCALDRNNVCLLCLLASVDIELTEANSLVMHAFSASIATFTFTIASSATSTLSLP